MIKVVNLYKNFGKLEVLKNISAEIHKGDIVAIIGPSGSGKSTFLRCLNRLEEPTDGHIYVKGEDLMAPETDINKVREKVGMVFQHFNLFPHKTVLENLTLSPMKLKGYSQEEADKKAMALLDKVGLREKADAYPNQLSGGQKQRIAMARALVHADNVLILDEATSALDNITQNEIMKNIKPLYQDKIVIIITHRLDTISDVDKIFVMSEGRICEEGQHNELMKKGEKYYALVQNL